MWTARGLSLLMIIFIGFFLVAHIMSGDAPKGPVTILSMNAIFIGLLLAWKWEIIGGLITIFGYLFFMIDAPTIFDAILYAVCVLAAILFIISWFLKRQNIESPAVTKKIL